MGAANWGLGAITALNLANGGGRLPLTPSPPPAPEPDRGGGVVVFVVFLCATFFVAFVTTSIYVTNRDAFVQDCLNKAPADQCASPEFCEAAWENR